MYSSFGTKRSKERDAPASGKQLRERWKITSSAKKQCHGPTLGKIEGVLEGEVYIEGKKRREKRERGKRGKMGRKRGDREGRGEREERGTGRIERREQREGDWRTRR